jgi:hypothetical protein
MSRQDFINGLRALGYQVEEHGDNKISFSYEVPVGRFMGQLIKLGFQVNDDFPANPPGGPHVSPKLLPLQSGGQHPSGQILASPFGDDWEYWSRPYPNWHATDRSVKAYMAHIRHLFDMQ